MNENKQHLFKAIRQAMSAPGESQVEHSRAALQAWFDGTAPLLLWDTVSTPVGELVVVLNQRGVNQISFTPDVDTVLGHADPLARSRRDPAALQPVTSALQAYFAGSPAEFAVPIDYEQMTPFQRRVLTLTQSIPAGTVWTYHQLAAALNKPKASRAVGQALARNPIPIIIPCHRVIASDGGLGGYAGGLPNKEYLLTLEGALS